MPAHEASPGGERLHAGDFLLDDRSRERVEHEVGATETQPGVAIVRIAEHGVVARVDGAIVGYALVLLGEPTDSEVRAVVTQRPVSELSKMYVLPQAHGLGVAHELMSTAVSAAGERGSVAVWLGVSNVNLRAQRFYGKAGFVEVGRKSFWLNGDEQRDFVMVRALR